MIRTLVVAVCLGAPLLVPRPTAARGPDTDCYARHDDQQAVERGERPAWRGWLTEWLRRHARRDSDDRVLYYLRSPLLYAFEPGRPADCADDEADAGDSAVADATDACADIVVETRADAELQMEVDLPQLGAHSARALESRVRRALANGDRAVVRDRDGHELVIYPALTRRVRVEDCS